MQVKTHATRVVFPWMRLVMMLLAILLMVSGCAGMSETQQRTVTGGAAGAAGGAAIGALAGNAAMGAAIGGATGLAGGFLYGKSKENEQRAFDEGYNAGRSGQ